MAVGHVDMTVYKSTDFSIDFDLTDDDGSALDLSNSTITAKIRTTPSSASVAKTFDTSSSTLASGNISLVLTATQTAGLSTGRLYWDLLSTSTGGTTTEKLLSGRIIVLEAISR